MLDAHLIRLTARAHEIEQDVLDPQMLQIGREVLAPRRKTHAHWGVCLLRVVQVVPRVRKLLAEIEGPVGADAAVHVLEHLSLVVEAVQRRHLQRDQNRRHRVVIKRIGRLGHA